MKNKFFLSLFLFLFLPAANSAALDFVNFWRHPEIAGKNSVFTDAGIMPLVLSNPEFGLVPLSLRIDWLPPLPLPFSLGVFVQAPFPNLKSFGVRAGYHFDLSDPLTDFFLLYSFDLGFTRNGVLAEYGDTPAEIRYYDFRAGIRRFFGKRFGAAVETGFKFESVIISLSIKLN
jgi:hypothetical protein